MPAPTSGTLLRDWPFAFGEFLVFTAITSFALPAPITDQQARAAFEASWRDLALAQSFFDEAWSKRIAERYGSIPTVAYFSSPVIVEGQG
jgi:hypothetical protein